MDPHRGPDSISMDGISYAAVPRATRRRQRLPWRALAGEAGAERCRSKAGRLSWTEPRGPRDRLAVFWSPRRRARPGPCLIAPSQRLSGGLQRPGTARRVRCAGGGCSERQLRGTGALAARTSPPACAWPPSPSRRRDRATRETWPRMASMSRVTAPSMIAPRAVL